MVSRIVIHRPLIAWLLFSHAAWSWADSAISMTNLIPGTLGSDAFNYNQWLANSIRLDESAPLQRPDTVTLLANVTHATPFMNVFILGDIGGKPNSDQVLALLRPDPDALAVPSGSTATRLAFKLDETQEVIFTPGTRYWLAAGVDGINYEAEAGRQFALLDWSFASATISTNNGWAVDDWIAVSNTHGAEWAASRGAPYIFSMSTIIVPEPSRAVLVLFGMLALKFRRRRPTFQKSVSVCLTLATLPILGTSCSKQASAPEDVLARVGAEVITVDDFKAAAVRRGGGNPASVNRQALLDELIDESALIQRAKAQGLDQTPEFKRRVRNLLIATLREKEAASPAPLATPEKADLMALYEELEPALMIPAARQLAILQATAETPDSMTVAVEKLKQAVQRFHSLPPDLARRGFGTIAAEVSEDQDTRYVGGDLGWLTDSEIKRRLPEAPAMAALTLTRPGTCSEVIQSGNTAFVLLLSGHRDAAAPAFEAVEMKLRAEFEARAAKAASAAQKSSLRQGLTIQTDEARLSSMELQAAPEATPSVPAGLDP